jgi:hypothetical protein
MSTAVLRDADAYTIEYDSELDAVAHTWEEFTSGQEFRDACEELLDCIEQRDTDKVLVDTSGIQAHDDEDQAWLQQDWIPRAIDAGMQYAGMVHSDSVISEMDMEEFMEMVADIPYEPMMTDDIDEARSWLAEQ